MTMDNETTDTERELLHEIDTLFKEMVIELIKQVKAGSRDADLIREVRECYSLLIRKI